MNPTRLKTGHESVLRVSGLPLKLLMMWVVVAGLGVGCATKAPASKAVTTTRHYTFWPEPPDEPRVQFLASFGSSDDVKLDKESQGLESLVFGEQKQAAVPINKPYGVAIWNGRIYVTDVRGQGVMVLDFVKHQARIMGGSGAGAVQKAVDIAIATDGTKYVCDPNRGSLMVFDKDDRFVDSMHLNDCSPIGVAVHGNEIYVCDFKQYNIRVIDRATGQQLRTIGKQGGEDGQFIRPLGITCDPQGNIIVGDIIRQRMQKFSPDGKLLLAFGQGGNRPGDFDKPKHLKVASDGITYVVDAAFNNVQLFDEQGKALMYFGGPGVHPGAMNLPAGLAISEADVPVFESYIHPAFQAERIIVVTNQFGEPNGRVAVYAMGHLKEGKTLADISTNRQAGETKMTPDMTGAVVPPAGSAPAATQPAKP